MMSLAPRVLVTTAVWLSLGGGGCPDVGGISQPTTLEPGRSSRQYRSFRYLGVGGFFRF